MTTTANTAITAEQTMNGAIFTHRPLSERLNFAKRRHFAVPAVSLWLEQGV